MCANSCGLSFHIVKVSACANCKSLFRDAYKKPATVGVINSAGLLDILQVL